eukprot:g7169.t1
MVDFPLLLLFSHLTLQHVCWFLACVSDIAETEDQAAGPSYGSNAWRPKAPRRKAETLMVKFLAILALGVVLHFPTSYGAFNVPGWRNPSSQACVSYEMGYAACSSSDMNSGYTSNDACRFCGRGNPNCTDGSWVDSNGYGCAFYDQSPYQYCGLYADWYANGGYTARDKCCVYCPDLPIPSNGGRGSCTSDKKTGEACWISCNDGYSISGGGYQYCQGVSWKSGQFKSAYPNSQSCVAATCAAASTPSNGGIGTCDGTKKTGQTCTITCNNGYSVSGGSTQTCTGTGGGSSAWPQSQSCAAATCATLATPSNGAINTCTGTKTTGQTCSITCNNGYSVSGGSTQTCTGTGVGSSAWPNSQSCAASTCATLATPSNGAINTCTGTKTTGQTCTITCNEGYTVSGGATQTCTGTGVGTSAWPNSQSCVALTSSASVTASQSATSSVSVTASQSVTRSKSVTASQSATSSVSVTASATSSSATRSVSVTASQSATSSVRVTASVTRSVSVTASQSATSSVSVTASQSATSSVSVTASQSATSSVSVTASQSATSSVSVTASATISVSVTASNFATSLMSVTASQSSTSSVSVTASQSATSSAGTLGGSFSKPSSSKASRALNISLSVVFTVIPALAIIFCVYKRKLITRNWRPSSPEKQQRAESSTSHKPNHRFWRLQHEPSHPTVEAVHARAQSPTSPSHRRPFRFWQSKQKLPTPMLEKACDVVLQLPVPANETNEIVPPPSEIKKQLAQQELDKAQKGDDVGRLEAALTEAEQWHLDVASAQQHLDELKVHRDDSKSTSAAAVTATPGNSTYVYSIYTKPIILIYRKYGVFGRARGRKSHSSSSVGLPAGYKYHVFLTHSWDQKDELGRKNHESVSRVNEVSIMSMSRRQKQNIVE